MGSAFTKDLKKEDSEKEKYEELAQNIKLKILNQELQQKIDEAVLKNQLTAEKVQQAQANTQLAAEKVQQAQANTQSKVLKNQLTAEKVEQAQANTQLAAEKVLQAQTNTKVINVFYSSVGFGFFCVATDHLLRGTRFGRKFCVRMHLHLSRSRFSEFFKGHVVIINDKARESVIKSCIAMTLPSILVGPTGSGKTTLLKQILDRVKNTEKTSWSLPRPTALVSLRSLGALQKENIGSEAAKTMELGEAATNLFRSIGFPSKTSVLSRFLTGVKIFRMGLVEVNMDTNQLEVSSRMKEALEVLFECLSDARGFVAFDEVHDLIRNDRLVDSGGRDVFECLAKLLVNHVVNSLRVQAVCAGSSNFLVLELNKTVACGTRLSLEFIQDVERPEMLSYLVNDCHIPKEVATFCLDKCGTRFRLLQRCIVDPSLAKVQAVVASLDITSEAYVKQFYVMLKKYPEALIVMRNLVNGIKMDVDNLPEDLQRVEKIGQILYVGLGSQLFFQNVHVERAWIKLIENKSTD